MAFATLIWAAIVVGVLVGWAWKSDWANLNVGFLDSAAAKDGGMKNPAAAVLQFVNLIPSLSSLKRSLSLEAENPPFSSISSSDYSSPKTGTTKSSIVNEDDLKHLHELAEEKDGGLAWIQMMDRSIPNMSYQAWRRNPETGPPQYLSRTVYEDATSENLRDFFWDDEFRLKWDDMIIHVETLEACPTTGTMLVKWVRKFPFFCSDREYIIGRRIWQFGRTYYCITKVRGLQLCLWNIRGEKVFLRVSPWRGIIRFGKKLCPRYIGPYEIIERIGPLAYRLALPPKLSQIHDVFHVSMLRRYRSDPSHILRSEMIEIADNLSYVKEPIEIVGYKEKQLGNRKIHLVKVLWRNHSSQEATWETEEHMKKQYPWLFTDTGINFEGEIL